MTLELTDRTLVCRDCGAEFVFTAGEQEFFKSKGLENDPSRCPECRTARRRSGGMRAERQYYNVTCASCGAEAQVPFEPRGDKPVYCNDCYARMREDSRR